MISKVSIKDQSKTELQPILPWAAIAFWICLSVNPISSKGVTTGGGIGGRGVKGGDGLLAMGGRGALCGVNDPNDLPLGGLWLMRDDWDVCEE